MKVVIWGRGDTLPGTLSSLKVHSPRFTLWTPRKVGSGGMGPQVYRFGLRLWLLDRGPRDRCPRTGTHNTHVSKTSPPYPTPPCFSEIGLSSALDLVYPTCDPTDREFRKIKSSEVFFPIPFFYDLEDKFR